MNIATALVYARPGEEWTLDGDDYAGLTWLSNTPKPTEQQITDAYPLAVAAKETVESERVAAAQEARDKFASLGFTEAMLAVMYPQLEGA